MPDQRRPDVTGQAAVQLQGGDVHVGPRRGGQALGILQVGEVRRPGEGLEAAAGDRLVGVQPVLDGDGVVALAPNDQGGHGVEQVEPVACADALPLAVDHRAQGVEEGLAGPGALERTHGPRYGLQVGALAAAVVAHPLARAVDAPDQPRTRDQREQRGGTRQRCGAE